MRILNSDTPAETKEHVMKWCKRKINEAKYVQVAVSRTTCPLRLI